MNIWAIVATIYIVTGLIMMAMTWDMATCGLRPDESSLDRMRLLLDIPGGKTWAVITLAVVAFCFVIAWPGAAIAILRQEGR